MYGRTVHSSKSFLAGDLYRDSLRHLTNLQSSYAGYCLGDEESRLHSLDHGVVFFLNPFSKTDLRGPFANTAGDCRAGDRKSNCQTNGCFATIASRC